jgi:hypothetical protein
LDIRGDEDMMRILFYEEGGTRFVRRVRFRSTTAPIKGFDFATVGFTPVSPAPSSTSLRASMVTESTCGENRTFFLLLGLSDVSELVSLVVDKR